MTTCKALESNTSSMIHRDHSQINLDHQPGLQLSQPAVKVENVHLDVQSGQQYLSILRGINWIIQPGNIQLLMGPSGSGKTSLLTILAGLLSPTRGKVYLLGRDITLMNRTQLAQFRLHHIGFIFQDFNLFPALTAAENIAIALQNKGVRGQLAQCEIQSLLERVGLEQQGHLKPRHLSGGQKQRVAIARALAGSPQLIMADEPTAALDSRSGHLVMELLRKLAKENGATVLMVTHDPRILDLADEVAHLEDGLLKAG